MINRRIFIRNSGLLALTVPLSKLPSYDLNANMLSAFGIQLYMVRDAMEKNTPGTLKQLGQMGYTQIESYSGSKGMFWGMSNVEFEKLAEKYGLSMVSSHYNDGDLSFDKQAALAAEIGMKYLICPWKGPQKSIDDFKRIAEDFNHRGSICKKHGLRFAYHPHDYPYKKVDGEIPLNVLLDNTDEGLVDYQMDFYYALTEGQSPEAYFQKYKNRFKLCHLRDVLKQRLPVGDKDESACDLGQGIVDYPHLLNIAFKNGMEYFFVEQSRYFHETEIQSAEVNARYMKKLKLV